MPTLSNEGNKIRRSQSQSVVNKQFSQDLLGLTLNPIDTGESASDKTSNTDGAVGGLDLSQTSGTSKEISDILGEFGDGIAQPKLPPKLGAPMTSKDSTPPGAGPPAPQRPSSVQREKIANNLIALPRPPSRHGSVITSGHATISGRIRTTPSPIPASLLGDRKLSLSRQDSAGPPAVGGTLPRPKRSSSSSPSREEKSAVAAATVNPSTLTNTPPRFGPSRGPSPLTLGMGDVIPIAVAFQEVCHACFRGADENQCQVRLIGDMMISFPAGIVQVFMNNPNPAPLLFRIKNSSVLETILPNKQLIHS